MTKRKILETHRLSFREFDLHDAAFILDLVNAPNWLQFIGDKGVKTIEDAIGYLKKGPIKSYRENGFGLWLVLLKDANIPIGMCGLVNRDTLNDIDIGFALHPEYAGVGYGYEMASATMNYAKYTLNLPSVIAITDSNNSASINLLHKIGLRFEKTLKLSEKDSVLVYSPSNKTKESSEIDQLTHTFFSLFTNTNGKVPDVKRMKNLFLLDGRIINNSKGNHEIYNLEEFITPREEILTNGTLTDFCESEISHKTEIFANVAHRFSLYKKSGRLHGEAFETKGVKTIQFIKIKDEWKMSSIAWSDEQ